MNKIIAIVVFLSSLNVMATPLLYRTDFWGDTLNPGISPISDPSGVMPAAVQTGESVSITFTSSGPGPAVRIGDTGEYFSGNFASYGSALSVNFMLESLDVVPNTLNLYFKTATDVWTSRTTIDLNGMALNSATPYSFAIGSINNWDWESGSGSQTFADGFSQVTEFGFELVGGAYYGSIQEYKFSDVQFTVPEPETYWMILMVLASLGITFRSRLMELAGQVKARIRA
jgi:hypothetical protein